MLVMRIQLLFAFLALGWCLGCHGTPTSGIDRMENAFLRGEMSIDDPQIVLATTGAIDLELETFAGTVHVIADPSLEVTTIEPVRRSTHGHLRRDEAAETLAAIDYRVNLHPSSLNSQTLEIRAWTSHPETHFQAIDFRIMTPSLRGVTISTSRGRVWVDGFSGSAEITTTRGDIRLLSDHPVHEAVTLLNQDGSIDFRVPGGSTGLFHCVAQSGDVYHRITAASITGASITNGPSKFAARVGAGTNLIEMRTTNADIRVAIVNDPTDVGALIFEP